MATARRHGLVLALFALLTVALSWPLALQLTTHVPGIPQWAFDESTFLWNIWHFKHTVIDQLVSPLHSELIWFPLGIDLILYTYNFFHVAADLLSTDEFTIKAHMKVLGYERIPGKPAERVVAYRRLRDDLGHADDIMAAAQPALVTVAEPATDYKE